MVPLRIRDSQEPIKTMKNIYKTLNDKELIDLCRDSKVSQEATDSMIERYQIMLYKIAHNHTKKYKNSSFEDNFQNAKIGLILACKRYNEIETAKFSTYLYKTVFHYLTTCIECESFVKCPTNLREVKSFLTNKYENNQDKSDYIKNKYDLKTENDINEFKKKFRLLNPDTIIVDDNINFEGFSINKTSDFSDEVLFNVFCESLSNNEQLIVKLICTGYNCSEISEILTKNGKNISEKKIRTILKKLKTKIVQ